MKTFGQPLFGLLLSFNRRTVLDLRQSMDFRWPGRQSNLTDYAFRAPPTVQAAMDGLQPLRDSSASMFRGVIQGVRS